jgi:hypothetical protein
MRVVQIGNFEPPHSTENELKRALEDVGCEVIPVQENMREAKAFEEAAAWAKSSKAAFVLWTRTGWNWQELGSSDFLAHEHQSRMIQNLRDAGIPTIGYHLDRWWGLSRQPQVYTEPFFRVDLLCTADGGHDDLWRAEGIEHVWFPPAVSRFECEPGEFILEMAHDVNFVGSWQKGYHAEWPHRQKLTRHIQTTWGAQMWPSVGQPAVRRDDLRNLYRSGRVFVGDSCLVPRADGTPATRYCSDRVPETLGRGGFLIHPYVEGVTGGKDPMYYPDIHLVTWNLGDWEQLDQIIEIMVNDDRSRIEIADAGRQRTLDLHTYSVRMTQLINLLDERKLL